MLRDSDPEILSRAKELYREGKTDREIAEALGVKEFHVSYWRRKNCLPANKYRNHRPPAEVFRLREAGVPMEEALSPSECFMMQTFLRCLLNSARKIPSKNIPEFVGRFIREWHEASKEFKKAMERSDRPSGFRSASAGRGR